MNRYTAKRYTYNGLTLRLSEWAARSGLDRSTLYRRIEKYKQSMHQALTDPARRGRRAGFKPAQKATSRRAVAVNIEQVLRSWGRSS